MRSKEAREIIKSVLGDQLTFEGHFDKVFDSMERKYQDFLIEWVKESKEGKCRKPDPSPKDPNKLIFFFKPNVNNIRGILEKEKNKYFLTLFLDKHKYYDRRRQELGF